MSRRRIFSAVGAATLLLAGLWLAFGRASERTYGGKTLVEILGQYPGEPMDFDAGCVRYDLPPLAPEIKFVDARAIPTILPWLDEQPTAVDWIAEKLTNIPGLPGSTRIGKFAETRRYDRLTRRSQAVFVFHRLGTNALPALPQLTALMTGSTDPAVRIAAAQALGGLGPDAYPLLTVALTNRATVPMGVALNALRTFRPAGTNTANLLPLLIDAAGSKEDSVDIKAAAALAHFQAPPGTWMPVLRRWLQRPAVLLYGSTDFYLGHELRGGDVDYALQACTPLLTDTNFFVRHFAQEIINEVRRTAQTQPAPSR